MIPVIPILPKIHETGSFSEYKKMISNKLRAKAAYAAAMGQNVFSNFDIAQSQPGISVPKAG